MARIRAFIMNNIFWIGLTVVIAIAIGGLLLAISGSEPEKSTSSIANLLFLKLAFAGLIVGAVRSRENTRIAATLVGAATIVLLIIVEKFETFFLSSSSSINNMIWVVLIAGLAWAAVVSREKLNLALTFAGLAGLILLVMLGKIDALFGWAILGLPIFAAAGFYGSTKVTGGAKTFLGFASGVIVLFWMHMFYQSHPVTGSNEFFNDVFTTLFPDETAKTIFVIFTGLTGLALWKKSKIFGILAIIVFLSFLGNSFVDTMIDRFPKKLTPSEETRKSFNGAVNSTLKKVGGVIENTGTKGLSGSIVAPGWQKVDEKIVDLSQIETIYLGQNQSIVKIDLPIKVPSPGNHRIKISGNYDFFLGDHTWTSFPWQGNNRLSGSPNNKPYKDLQYGAITLLNNGENITPATNEGIIAYLNTTSNFSIRVNAFTRNPTEWYSAKIGRMILKNSSDKPLTITIEKEVEN
ncbi:MAG: hypothetical protein RBS77_02405 [Candidatus Moranbacteria bacterium]|jgi:hypothetical protein|nr:hypothetical protein [Candidatus Moranbacteria bacterium]